MGTIFEPRDAGISVFAPTRDHCPPHVHCENRQKGWTILLEFSFLTNQVSLYEVRGKKPRISEVDAIAEMVAAKLHACRKEWWRIRATTCLDNQTIALPATGTVRRGKRSEKDRARKRITASRYDPNANATTLQLADGSEQVIKLG
jgi:hypothetical protein